MGALYSLAVLTNSKTPMSLTSAHNLKALKIKY
jgi:hypothetical protein